VSSALASSVKIGCEVSTTLDDVSSGKIILETAAVAATRSGSTATCAVTIPYSWSLASGSTDKVSLSYNITAPVEATSSTVLPSRSSLVENFLTISVPGNGTTTTEAVTATF
jgi:hypothetical protein